MGIRDAANLAFKLDLVLRGVCGDALLDTYQDERWDNCAALIEGATKRGKMISASTRLAILKRNFAFLLGRLSHRAGFEMTRRMNDRRPYRSGLLDGSSGAGEVMTRPRVRVADREVWFEQVLGSEFALVTAEGAEGPSTRWFETALGGRIAEIGRDFDDVHGQVQAWLEGHGATSVIVRPDRYVFGTSAMAEELCASLRKAFAALDARPPREAR